jgi:short-subunit dehydrogenase
MKVAPVVSQSLRALGRKPTVIAGLRNRLFIGSARLAPRRLMTRILGTAFEKLRSGKNG